MRICVLGAGVIGVTTAYFLAKDGHEVTIVDRNGLPGQEASYANGIGHDFNHRERLGHRSLRARWKLQRPRMNHIAATSSAARLPTKGMSVMSAEISLPSVNTTNVNRRPPGRARWIASWRR